ncbi:mechanosensitive ion channel family protein [Hydrogenimonas sp.]
MMRALLFALWLGVAALAASPASTPAQTVTETPRAPEPTPYYPPDTVPDEAAATAAKLAAIAKSFAESDESETLAARIARQIASSEKLISEPLTGDLSQPSLQRLRSVRDALLREKRALEKEAAGLEAALAYDKEALQELDTLRTKWRATLEHARASHAPEAIALRAEETLAQLATTYKRLKKRYDATLTLYDRLTGQTRRIQQAVERVEEALARRGTELFALDAPNLFATLREEGFHPLTYAKNLYGAGRYILEQARLFFAANLAGLYGHLLATLLLGLTLLYLHLKKGRGRYTYDENDKRAKEATLFIDHPFAATIVVAALASPLFYPDRPTPVGELFALLALGAVLFIVRPALNGPVRLFIYTLSLLFALTILQNHLPAVDATVRVGWLAMALVLLAVSGWLARPGGALADRHVEPRLAIFLRLTPLIPLLALLSAAANLLGAVNLALKLLSALVTSLLLLILFMVLARIFRGLVAMLVRHRARESHRLVRQEAERIENYLVFLIDTGLLLYWGYLVLKQFDLLFFVEEWWRHLMAHSWQIGRVTVSLGALVDFLLVLALTWFLTRLVTVLLELELFSRYRFPRGVPAAIQMIVRYLIITVGVVFALTVLGVRLTDLSLIAGALGVGIGFGLRNIMANFVSGLLLVFERPVQQGDVVQVGQVFGDVQKIGVRATTIKTYDGSEVIVPNADFITKEVTNWTLSSKSRRVKLTYRVAPGAHPRQVIALIGEAIEKIDGIRSDPAPKILFDGFGDYYLEFVVYFWVDERVLDIKSEAGIAIFKALESAGIRMPTPHSTVQYENITGEKP